MTTFHDEVEQLRAQYPESRSAVMPALRIAQERHDGWLPPEARRTGPDCPSAIASSAERKPTPRVRSSQICCRSTSASYSSTAFGIQSQNSRAFA